MKKNFSKMTKMIAAALVLSVISFNASAQAIATATASATIVSPISLAKNVDMNFGNLSVASFAGGTVTLDPSVAATRTASGGGGLSLPAISGTVSAAKFTVSGQANFTYAITLPSSAALSGPGAPMLASAFTSSITGGIGTLDGAGTQVFYVGADLDVAAAQAPGVYTTSGAFLIGVNYN